MGDRARSRSPNRRDGDRSRPKKTGGFRWKEKRRDDDTRGEERRLDRGYRDRDERPRSPRRDRDERPRSPRRDREGDRYGDRNRDQDRDRDRDQRRDERDPPREDRVEKKDKKEKKKKKPIVPQSSEPMIIVHVNDRLGTKAEIPCLASDPISMFFLPTVKLAGLKLISFLFRTLQSPGGCSYWS